MAFETLILRRKITAKHNDTSILTKFSTGLRNLSHVPLPSNEYTVRIRGNQAVETVITLKTKQ
jgi:hypothetical protein